MSITQGAVLDVEKVGPVLVLEQGGRQMAVCRPGRFALKRGPFSLSLMGPGKDTGGGAGNGVW